MASEQAELLERLAQLEYRVELMTNLVDSERNPFLYLCLESGITREQKRQILDLMDETRAAIRANRPMDHHTFEQRVYEICPRYRGDYHFAEAIVSTLRQTHQWTDVYEFMKTNGMNLS